MTNLLALADRVEKLTGPDRDVDEAIRVAMFYPPRPWNYTASLDAAMTLVPEEHDWCLGVGCDEPANAAISPANMAASVSVDAATPAIALTAACLRARASTKGES